MRITRALWQHRQPMIKFLGKRHIPKEIDHSPHAHPASPDHSLPETFAQYRGRAQSHGPLGNGQQGQRAASSKTSASAPSPVAGGETIEPYGSIGGHSGRDLGSVKPSQGEVWDRNELPARFRRRPWSEAEIDAVDTAGASMWS